MKSSIRSSNSVFPPEAQPQIRLRLADTLKASISQRLLLSADGKGRVLAAELMFVTAVLGDCIRDAAKTAQIKNFIEEGSSTYGMQAFDQHLSKLLVEGRISRDVSLDAATSFTMPPASRPLCSLTNHPRRVP